MGRGGEECNIMLSAGEKNGDFYILVEIIDFTFGRLRKRCIFFNQNDIEYSRLHILDSIYGC